MKSFVYFVPLLCLSVVGCKSTEDMTSSREEVMEAECVFPDEPTKKAPLWVCDVPVEGYALTGVGFSEKRPTQRIMKEVAMKNAQAKMAAHFSTSVSELYQSQVKDQTAENVHSFEEAVQLTTEALTSQNLVGTKIVRTMTSPKMGMYVLMSMDDTAYKATMEKAMSALVDDEATMRKMFDDSNVKEMLTQ